MTSLAVPQEALSTIAVVAASAGLPAVAVELACWGCRSARWQKAFWQSAVLAISLLAGLEITGLAPASIDRTAAWLSDSTRSLNQQNVISPAPAQADFAPQVAVLSSREDSTLPVRQVIEPPTALSQGPPLDLSRFVGNGTLVGPFPAHTPPQGIATVIHDSPCGIRFARDMEVFDASSAPRAGIGTWISRERVASAAIVLWFLGTLLISATMIVSRMLAWIALGPVAATVDRSLVHAVESLREQLGFHRAVRVIFSDRISSPAALGIVGPTVALPATFCIDYDLPARQAILAHELAHLAACDPHWQAVCDMLCAVLWWHPAAWWTRRRLRETSELAADEASLLVPGGPLVLARSLVGMGRRMVEPIAAGSLSFSGTPLKSQLARRVEHLMKLRPARSLTPYWVTASTRAATSCLLVTLILLVTAWARPQAAFGRGEIEMHFVKASWNRSLLSGLLMAITEVSAAEPPDDTSVPQLGAAPPAASDLDSQPPKDEAPTTEAPAADDPNVRPDELASNRPEEDAPEERGQEPRDPERRNLDEVASEIRDKTAAYQREAREIIAKFQRELAKIAEREQEIQGHLVEGRARDDIDRLQEELDELHRRRGEVEHELARESQILRHRHIEEMERIERQARRMRDFGPPPPGRPPRRQDVPPDDVDDLGVLGRVLDRLRQRGLGEEAEMIVRELERRRGGPPEPRGRFDEENVEIDVELDEGRSPRFRQRIEESRRPFRPGGPPDPFRPEPPPRPDQPPRPEPIEKEVQSLRNEMNSLRRELEEIRRELRKLNDRGGPVQRLP